LTDGLHGGGVIRRCEPQSDEAIQLSRLGKLDRFARNDGKEKGRGSFPAFIR
jgi:hypothetical protein